MSWEDNLEGKPLELFEKEIKDSAVWNNSKEDENQEWFEGISAVE